MAVSYASLVTDNLDLNLKITLPKLQPHSLQELCRFQIRKSIRQSIETENEDYYKIKREMSTFNPNRDSKRSERISDDNDSEDERMLLSSRLLPTNSNIENRLRMMIYGHLADANIRLSDNLVDDDVENAQSRVLALLRSIDNSSETNEESEPSPRETRDSGIGDGSQSSSLTESSEPLVDHQQSKKVKSESENEEKRENLLRLRVMQLSIPSYVKNFVLYHRDI